MRVDLPGQLEIPIRAISVKVPAPSGTKEQLAVLLAQLLINYENRPSSRLWIEIQACAREILK
jgi:hypothetical protein